MKKIFIENADGTFVKNIDVLVAKNFLMKSTM